MYFNKASPPLNSIEFSGVFVCGDRSFLILIKNFCIIIIEGRTKSDKSFKRNSIKRRDYVKTIKNKKIDLRLTEKEKESIQ